MASIEIPVRQVEAKEMIPPAAAAMLALERLYFETNRNSSVILNLIVGFFALLDPLIDLDRLPGK